MSSDIEILAVWLNGAAIDIGRQAELRKLVKLALVHADEMYTPDDPDPLEDNDPLQVKEVLGRFAAALDEDDRDRKAGE